VMTVPSAPARELALMAPPRIDAASPAPDLYHARIPFRSSQQVHFAIPDQLAETRRSQEASAPPPLDRDQ